MQDDNIIDIPEGDDDHKSRWNFLKYFSLALLVPGAVGMFMEMDSGGILVTAGLALLFFRMMLLFVTREKKFLFEYFYLAGIASFIIIFSLRILFIYRNDWLLLVAGGFFALGILLVRSKEENETESLDQ